jgi:hypothetical protein
MTHGVLRFFRLVGLAAVIAGAGLVRALPGQMHKVAPPENVVRAVGVYEWTGDMAKPTASRLIPVSLFIDGHLEDAGVYMARPVPFALGTGTVYEVDQAGIAKGVIDLMFARHLQGADLATVFDDGWFGYGSFKGPPAPKPLAAAHKPAAGRRPRAEERVDDDPSRPHLIRKPGSEGDDAGAKDSGQAKGKGTAGGSSTEGSASQSSASSSADDDPDRPHFSRKPDASGSADGSTGSAGDSTQSSSGSGGQSSGSTPADDPDRPTLKKRTPEQAKQARREAEQSSVSGTATSLNDDPNRPTLHRGVPTHALTEADFPKLKGVPESLHQMVAVSDAKNREPHDFARPWQDDAERATVLASMQTLARALLASYGTKPGASTTGANTAKGASTPAVTGGGGASTNSSSSAKTGAATASGTKSGVHNNLRRKITPVQVVPLLDEELKGYTLSYGGADTFVYMAHTDGDGDALRYVTVVAQKDSLGTLQPAIQSVTDAAHLDRTPRMRLVDVVDAEASNRASLLFEMRGEQARQFALYRVIAARAEQTFLTGTTQ